MALSEANEVKLCQILQITPSLLDYQISYLGSNLTSTIQTAIEAQITLWDAGAGTGTTKIHPKESNRGVETNPTQKRTDIRKNIAILLERPDWGSSGSFLQRS